MKNDIVAQVAAAERALSRLDPILGELINAQGSIVRGQPDGYSYFASLARSIVGQQISVLAAAKIFGRFEEITKLDPEATYRLTEEQQKTIGLSRQKATYLRDLASHFVRDSAIFNHLDSLNDDDAIVELTRIKGIGVWTAQMFLMFTLQRLDVFAPDDIGLQNAMKLLYGWAEIPKRAELETFAERWKPYRTVACWHLWQLLDNEPVQ